MSFLKNIFGSGDEEKTNSSSSASVAAKDGPEMQFGRYTDANKNQQQLDYWKESKKLFDEKKYVESYQAFFQYLKDPANDNVQYSKEGESVAFKITQGSKVIEGIASNNKVEAEVDIAKFSQPHVAFMRKLMNMNYGLQYSRFCLKEDNITMKFSSHVIDCSPTKMYYSLKELCTKADKQDDLLTDEFSMLEPVGTEHVIELSELEKETKYKYLQQWIDRTLNRAAEFDEDKFSGAISYLYLSLVYRVDYLLSPEGGLTYELEKINSEYFKKDGRSFIEKNRTIKELFEKIKGMPKEEVVGDFYNVKQAFGVVSASSHKQVADFIYNETPNTKWYKDNNYPDVVLAIYEYIVGYCFFNYGMYEPCIELMHLFMRILHPEFFKELGFKDELVDQNGKPIKSKIEPRLAEINKEGKRKYPYFNFKTNYIRYDSMLDFGETFMKEIDYLNFSTKAK